MSGRHSLSRQLDDPHIGEEILALAADIYPICRSITGDGVRKTLERLHSHVNLEVHEVPSGTAVFDWTIPREWNIRDAYIKDPAGEKVVDFQKCNLHVVGYSTPVHKKLPLSELRKHLFTLPEQPDLIPYRTSYYTERWGFCLAHDLLLRLADGVYEVLIDASLEEGSLTYGEYLHQGSSDDEFLLSAHICHPSLANDNCSGLALLTQLARRLKSVNTRYSYRFLFAPGTIGAIAWLARNEPRVDRIRHGLVVSCVGDSGGPTYKRSRRGNAPIDRAMAHVLRHHSPGANVLDFSPYGYDERQYCSPGFNLPVGLFQRSRFESFPEYHTSADNLDFITADDLAESYRIITRVFDIIEDDWWPESAYQKCEPQLGRRNLYRDMGGYKAGPVDNLAMLWTLNLADGSHSLLDMAERADLPFECIAESAQRLLHHGLLYPPIGARAGDLTSNFVQHDEPRSA